MNQDGWVRATDEPRMTNSPKLARFGRVGRTIGIFRIVWIAMNAVLLLAAAACDSSIRVSGTVRDPHGNPLDGVAVTLQSEDRGPHVTTTANDGSFGVGIVGADAHRTRLIFTRAGYKNLEVPLGDTEHMVVTLEPESGEQPHMWRR